MSFLGVRISSLDFEAKRSPVDFVEFDLWIFPLVWTLESYGTNLYFSIAFCMEFFPASFLLLIVLFLFFGDFLIYSISLRSFGEYIKSLTSLRNRLDQTGGFYRFSDLKACIGETLCDILKDLRRFVYYFVSIKLTLQSVWFYQNMNSTKSSHPNKWN